MCVHDTVLLLTIGLVAPICIGACLDLMLGKFK